MALLLSVWVVAWFGLYQPILEMPVSSGHVQFASSYALQSLKDSALKMVPEPCDPQALGYLEPGASVTRGKSFDNQILSQNGGACP